MENLLEEIIHKAFHDIASKFNVDVDLVAQIINEFDEIMSKKLDKRFLISKS